jgi:hypothetical protein
MRGFWQETLLDPLRELGRQAVASLPGLVAMIILVVLGLIIGWIVKEVFYRVLRLLGFDRLCDRLGLGSLIDRVGLARSASYLAGQIVQGFIVLIALLAGLNALDTPLTRNLVARFFDYLPHLVAALLVLIAGSLISRFLGRSVLIAAVNSQMPSARLLAGLTRFFVMTLTVVAALDELGISRTTIIVTFAILFGGVVAAASIALGLGARDLARDLLQTQFRPRSNEKVEDVMRHL